MQRQVQLTGDGSHTIAITGSAITYHSTRGAVQESMHVFIQAGLLPMLSKHHTLRVFEVGFGTGLNALLTLQQAISNNKGIHYTTAELYPLAANEYSMLNYCTILHATDLQPYFTAMHQAVWNEEVIINPSFTLHKMQDSIDHVNHLANTILFTMMPLHRMTNPSYGRKKYLPSCLPC